MALIHTNSATTEDGNSLLSAPAFFFEELFVRAADKCHLRGDRLIAIESMPNAEQARADIPIERNLISGAAATEWGAHLTSCCSRCGINVRYHKEYSSLTRQEGGWKIYCNKCLNCSEGEYQKRIGGTESIASLSLSFFL